MPLLGIDFHPSFLEMTSHNRLSFHLGTSMLYIPSLIFRSLLFKCLCNSASFCENEWPIHNHIYNITHHFRVTSETWNFFSWSYLRQIVGYISLMGISESSFKSVHKFYDKCPWMILVMTKCGYIPHRTVSVTMTVNPPDVIGIFGTNFKYGPPTKVFTKPAHSQIWLRWSVWETTSNHKWLHTPMWFR